MISSSAKVPASTPPSSALAIASDTGAIQVPVTARSTTVAIEARAVADYNKTISASLSPEVLEFDRIEQLTKLAQSTNAKTVLIGPGAGPAPVLLTSPAAGKDGH